MVEFPLNYIKLATMPIKAYVGKSNKFSRKGYLKWGLNLRSRMTHFDAYLTELTMHCLQDWDF